MENFDELWLANFFVLEGDVLYPAVCNEMYDHNTWAWP